MRVVRSEDEEVGVGIVRSEDGDEGVVRSGGGKGIWSEWGR